MDSLLKLTSITILFVAELNVAKCEQREASLLRLFLYQVIFTIRRPLKTLRYQELRAAANLIAADIKHSKDDELYFQDLPIYNKGLRSPGLNLLLK